MMKKVTIDDIRKRLQPAFNPQQVEALAGLAWEIHSSQPPGILALQEAVQNFALAQHELAGAQRRTEEHLDALTAQVSELAHAQSELAQAQKRTEERIDHLAQAQMRTEEAVQMLAAKFHTFAETLGANLEDLAVDIVPELLEKHWGLQVESAGPEDIPMPHGFHPFDLVIRGWLGSRRILVLGEVKSNLTLKEVERFAKLVAHAREIQREPEVRMLFFGFRAERAARERILELGGSMVFSRGVILPS